MVRRRVIATTWITNDTAFDVWSRLNSSRSVANIGTETGATGACLFEEYISDRLEDMDAHELTVASCIRRPEPLGDSISLNIGLEVVVTRLPIAFLPVVDIPASPLLEYSLFIRKKKIKSPGASFKWPAVKHCLYQIPL